MAQQVGKKAVGRQRNLGLIKSKKQFIKRSFSYQCIKINDDAIAHHTCKIHGDFQQLHRDMFIRFALKSVKYILHQNVCFFPLFPLKVDRLHMKKLQLTEVVFK